MDSTTRDQMAMLCDELLRRGVPHEVVQPIIDWLDAQDPLRSTYRVMPSGGDGPLCCYSHAPKILPCMIMCPACGDKRCMRALECSKR